MEMMTTMPAIQAVPQGTFAAIPAGDGVAVESCGAGVSLFADILLGIQLPISTEGTAAESFPAPENSEPVKDDKEKGTEGAIIFAMSMVPMLPLPTALDPLVAETAPQRTETGPLQMSAETSLPIAQVAMPMAQQTAQAAAAVAMQADFSAEMESQGEDHENMAAASAQLLPDEGKPQLATPEKQDGKELLSREGAFQQPGKRDLRLGKDASSPVLPEAELSRDVAGPSEGDMEHPRLKPEQIEVTVMEKKADPQVAMKGTSELSPETSVGHGMHTVDAHHGAPKPEGASQPAGKELSQNILSQVKEGIITHDGKGNGTISIKLSPEELGNLQITMNMEDRRLTVEVIADNPMVKEALANNLDSLKETLLRQNLRIEQFDVATGGQSFSRQFEQGANDRRETPKLHGTNPFMAAQADADQVQKVYIGDRRQALVDLRL